MVHADKPALGSNIIGSLSLIVSGHGFEHFGMTVYIFSRANADVHENELTVVLFRDLSFSEINIVGTSIDVPTWIKRLSFKTLKMSRYFPKFIGFFHTYSVDR